MNVDPTMCSERPRSRHRGPARSSPRWSGRDRSPGWRARARSMERKNRVNRSALLRLGDPEAVVADLETQPCRRRPRSVHRTQPPSSVNFSALLTRLATSYSRLCTSPRTITGVGWHLEGHLQQTRREDRLERRLRRRHHLAQVHVALLVGERPRLQARERQQLVGQRRQPVTVATNRLDELLSGPRSGSARHPPRAAR